MIFYMSKMFLQEFEKKYTRKNKDRDKYETKKEHFTIEGKRNDSLTNKL